MVKKNILVAKKKLEGDKVVQGDPVSIKTFCERWCAFHALQSLAMARSVPIEDLGVFEDGQFVGDHFNHHTS